MDTLPELVEGEQQIGRDRLVVRNSSRHNSFFIVKAFFIFVKQVCESPDPYDTNFLAVAAP